MLINSHQIIQLIIIALILIPTSLACYNLIIIPQKLIRKHINCINQQLRLGSNIETINGNMGKVLHILNNTIIVELENGCKTEILKYTIKKIL